MIGNKLFLYGGVRDSMGGEIVLDRESQLDVVGIESARSFWQSDKRMAVTLVECIKIHLKSILWAMHVDG